MALHVNYGLRDDSDGDEAHCARLCERLGVALEIERPRDRRVLAICRPGLAIRATRRRHGWRCPVSASIATGHTADDQVETILYRLASSPSRRALLGMRRRDGSLVRPLLGFTREETTAYCEERRLALAGRPDQRRARLRAQPRPQSACSGAGGDSSRRRGNVLRTAELLRDEAEVLDALVDAELGGANGGERGTIELQRLAELPGALRRLVVQRLADRAAGRPGARRRQPR